MKNKKTFILLLMTLAWTGVHAESFSEAEDYIYQKGTAIDKSKYVKRGGDIIVSPTVVQDTINIEQADMPLMPIGQLDNDTIVDKITEVGIEKPVLTRQLEVKADTTKNIEVFKREIESVVFVPKGQWIIGLSVSYSQSSQNKFQFLVLEGISGDTYSFKISPMVMFTVAPDLALGGRFSYARSLTKVANADIVLDSETSYTFDHLYRLSHNYYGALLMRNYFSIGKSKRFGFFNEVQLQMGGGQTKLTTGVGDDLTGTYERNFSLNVGLNPGLCIFLSNYSALEVNVGLLGFNYIDTRSMKDQIYVSKRNSKSANFRINLFSITFGATFYL